MNQHTTYQKISSYEPKKEDVKKVLLLFSGGLDTSTMLKWIQDEYNAEVITLTLDIGQQGDDLVAIKAKAEKLGAKKAIVYDAKDRFADEVIAKGIKANARYQGDYHLSTPMGRVITSQIGVEVAKAEGCDTIAHGSTGKGNDQVRFEGYALAVDPNIKVIAPVREWNMDRDEQIEYAEKHGIPVPVKKDFPYSVDDNMWGMTWEGGEIEDPALVPPVERFLTTYTLPKNAPNEEEYIDIEFEKGIPVSLNGQKDKLSKIIEKLNKIGGKHGVGVVHLLEDRMIGLKDRGVYELPAGHILVRAHEELEKYVSTRTLNEVKSMLDIKWGYMCYAAQWFDPAMEAINAFNEEASQRVNGSVKVRLFKGIATPVAIDSAWGMGHASFSTKRGYMFNVNAAPGFTEIHTLQMKIAQEVKRKNEAKAVNFQGQKTEEFANSSNEATKSA
jgi:argininosuccinate synthase